MYSQSVRRTGDNLGLATGFWSGVGEWDWALNLGGSDAVSQQTSVIIELHCRTPGWHWRIDGWKAHTPGIHPEVQSLLKSRGESLCRALAKKTDFQAPRQTAVPRGHSGIGQVWYPWQEEKTSHLSTARVLASALTRLKSYVCVFALNPPGSSSRRFYQFRFSDQKTEVWEVTTFVSRSQS